MKNLILDRRLRVTISLLSAAFVLASSGRAQDSSSIQNDQTSRGTAPPSAPRPSHAETSVSLGAAAQLTAERLSSGQSLDPSVSVLGTFRQSFRPWFGYSVNLGYTRTTSHNAFGNSSYAIPANMYEASFSYLAQTYVTRRLTGFVDVGAGMISFLPVNRGANAIKSVPNGSPALVPPVTFRPLGVSGIGIDYHYTPHLALRAEYRGLLYKYPDYGLGLGRSITLSSQPTLSLTYTFGKTR